MKNEESKEITRPQSVFESIEKMTQILSRMGIAKEKGNTKEIQYNFRGIDDIRNNTSPLMYDCAMNIIPCMQDRVEKERHTKSGTLALWVTILVNFKIYNTISKDFIEVPIYADAVDYSDKSTQKAMSQAYKVLAINLFNIPTEGEQDTDSDNIQMQAINHSSFESPELRKQYVENCTAALTGATTQKALTDIYELYRDKISLMFQSKDADDAAAGKSLREIYATKFRELKTAVAGSKL